MILQELHILNYKNIREADLTFAEKLNCFVGLNGQGKTNLLDAIYLLSFTKSAFVPNDSQAIMHGEELCFVRGKYKTVESESESELEITCGLKRGVKKQFRRGTKDYKRLLDHIGLIPLVMISPEDNELIAEGSDERRRFLDVVIAQYNKSYLENLTKYNALLKQRNAVLKEVESVELRVLSPEGHDRQSRMESSSKVESSKVESSEGLLEVLEMQMAPLAQAIFEERTRFVEEFIPIFQEIYNELADGQEQVSLRYISQLQNRDLMQAYQQTRQRDLILGWTSQGIHKDELEMLLGDYPLKRVGSQGQQKTFLLAMKLAQAIHLGKPILLLDDIFDKLDSERVQRIIRLVNSDRFGQIFITDTDRQHLTEILRPNEQASIFHVQNGVIEKI